MQRAAQLLKYLREYRCLYFGIAPGEHDCALFVAGWVQICQGRDIGSQWRGKYRSLADGRKLLQEAGFQDLDALAKHFLPPVHGGWRASEVGDVAVLEERGETCLGIIGGPQIHVLSQSELNMAAIGRAKLVFRP